MNAEDLDPDAASLSRQCVKCEDRGLLAGSDPRKAVYCRPCFIQMVKHKFRSSLGKRRIYKDGATKATLLLFDGSPSASFALGQLIESSKDTQHRKMMIEPTVLFLILTYDYERVITTKKKYLEIATSLDVPFLIVHISTILQNEFELSADSEDFINGSFEQYKRLHSNMKTSTARIELQRLMTEIFVAKISLKLGIDKVWMPITGDDLARNTISFFSLGRGGNCSSLISVTERRHKVNMLRPMYDICDKEVFLINQLEGYNIYNVEENIESLEANSVHAVASTFISRLQKEGFKATTSTLLASTSKIFSKSSKCKEMCRLCDFPITEGTSLDCDTNLLISSLCLSCQEIRSECDDLELFDSAFSIV